MEKRLTKSPNKMICGVCAGIADYFNIDPTIIRLAFALLSICFGGGVLLYIVCAIVMPEAEF